ncbi:MAG: FtsW/RodA/SpoVE family cell cycle protein [Oscillospiraceae bacterium]|nr:FtsW/RodA/SpoVE family cell cycle protein [Oscillospiraceae bacterium]
MKKLRDIIKKYFSAVDKWLLFFCLSISLTGILCQYSLVNSNQASTLNIGERVALVQVLASLLGIGAAIIVSNFDYHFMTRLWKLYMPISVGLVLLTFFIGMQVDETIDDKAWLRLPFGLTFQPSELLKICFIMSFAYHLSKVYGQLNRPQNLILLCLHGAFPVVLIHFQGDDGTALVFGFIFLTMIIAAGLSWKYIVAAIPIVAGAIPVVWQYFLSDDQRKRFLAVYFTEYADPLGADYQQRLSRISIGLGQLQGEGLFQESYWYVPKMHNDFVFSFICQALGFVGALLVLSLLFGICFRCIIDAKNALDPLGAYICYGVFAMFFFQCIINIGMCISILPVIGITLPLLSAGGTSIAITYLGIGLVLSVHVHKRRNLFYE